MNTPALRLWTGKTVHHRYSPFERRFSYDICLIDLDIDRLEEASRQTPLFSVGRPALFSFRPEDNGPQDKRASLRKWAEDMYRAANVDLDGGPIRLITFARHLFYKFAPLSLWYGYDLEGNLRGIIYEVNNTFGERHCYVAATDEARSQHEADKSFHVSPFMCVTGQYRFTLRTPDDRLLVTVENWENGVRTHVANIVAEQAPAKFSTLLQLAVTQPFSSLGVMAAIHWQALKIWMRGAGYHRKPAPPGKSATIANRIANTAPLHGGEKP